MTQKRTIPVPVPIYYYYKVLYRKKVVYRFPPCGFIMDSSPGYYDDDDCESVQLEGSDMTPRAAKVCLFLFKTNTR